MAAINKSSLSMKHFWNKFYVHPRLITGMFFFKSWGKFQQDSLRNNYCDRGFMTLQAQIMICLCQWFKQ